VWLAVERKKRKMNADSRGCPENALPSTSTRKMQRPMHKLMEDLQYLFPLHFEFAATNADTPGDSLIHLICDPFSRCLSSRDHRGSGIRRGQGTFFPECVVGVRAGMRNRGSGRGLGASPRPRPAPLPSLV
jgi:hypothetical protein